MKIRTTLPIALAAILAGALACAGDATAPATPLGEVSITAEHRSGGSPGSRAAFVRCEHHPAAYGSAYIGPRGGRVTAGDVTLIVPPGALPHTVRITATVPEGDARYVSFEPHGLVFRKAAGLVFGAEGCQIPPDPDVLYIRHGQVLERIDARYIPYLQVFAAPIDHFSGYVLAW